MPAGPAGIYAGVNHRGLDVLVSKKVFNPQEVAGIRIEKVFCAEMPKLMGCKCDSRSFSCEALDQIGHRALALGSSVNIHEEPFRLVTDVDRRKTVAVFEQHPDEMCCNIETDVSLVFDLWGV